MFYRIIKWIKKPLQVEQEKCLRKAYEAQKEVYHILEGRQELQAVGIAPCRQGYSVKINLSSPLPKEVAKKLPKKVEGVPVKTEVVGSIFV